MADLTDTQPNGYEIEKQKISNDLWHNPEKVKEYGQESVQYQDHLFEQYKMFVEMADRISSRRSGANVFFLSLNTSIITCISFFIEKVKAVHPEWVLIFPFIGILMICLIWWAIIRSYKNLNSGKFQVIQLMEEQLPSTPYKAEWKALGEGKDKRKYFPLTNIEQWIPIIFAALYLALALFSQCGSST